MYYVMTIHNSQLTIKISEVGHLPDMQPVTIYRGRSLASKAERLKNLFLIDELKN